MAKWKKKNDKISQEIKTKSSEVEEQRRLLDDPHRKRDEESRRMRLAAIARRTRLVMKAENNYDLARSTRGFEVANVSDLAV